MSNNSVVICDYALAVKHTNAPHDRSCLWLLKHYPAPCKIHKKQKAFVCMFFIMSY